MSDALSLADLDVQRAELLPRRTLMSMFNTIGVGGGRGGEGGVGGRGGVGRGGIGANLINVNLLGDQTNAAGSGYGGAGGATIGPPVLGAGQGPLTPRPDLCGGQS